METVWNVPITKDEAREEGWEMARCKIDPEKTCVGENLPEKMDKSDWSDERQRHYELAEAMHNGCRPDPDHTKPMITMNCPECNVGRLIDQRHRNGTTGKCKVQVVCDKCRWSGYRLE